jgi:O-antigen/teichoic acid export membrane protein
MLKSIATVLGGNVAAQALGLAILPLLTRLFPTEAFGHYQFFQSVTSLLIVPAGLLYELALLRAREGSELRAVLWLCLLTNIGFAALSCAAVIFIHLLDPAWLSRVPFSLFLLPLTVLIGSLAVTLSYILMRYHAFFASGVSKVAQSAVFAGAAGGIGAANPIPTGLVIADIGGRAVLAAYEFLWTLRRFPGLLIPATRRRIAAAARRYREYPMIGAPGVLINAAGSALTPILIYTWFTPAVSGQFGLVERSLTLPLALIAGSISQVFTARCAAHIRAGSEKAVHEFKSVVIHAGLLGAAPALLLIAVGPQLFGFVFGAEWRVAGEFARYLSIGYWAALAFGTIQMTLVVIGRQRLQLAWAIGRLTCMVALGCAVVAFDWSPLYAVIGYSMLMAASSISFILIAFLALKRHVRT